ncbi:hypothetical protein P3434_23900, partial [Vibrio parahaemolyticus]|nr:hypothetical protein [Vibrio parahaemolyticus]
ISKRNIALPFCKTIPKAIALPLFAFIAVEARVDGCIGARDEKLREGITALFFQCIRSVNIFRLDGHVAIYLFLKLL